MLEVNYEICVPEEHNYDGTDFRDVAELASERQKRVGYIARDWTDEDPITAMNRVDREKPTIVSITNHGIPGGIYFNPSCCFRIRGKIIGVNRN